MPKTLELITEHLPRITQRDLRRFSDSIEILDPKTFAAELQAFIHERMESLQRPSALHSHALTQTLTHKAAALRAERRWQPDETDIQRGRSLLLEAFEQAHNLPLPRFAQLAGKSRQQIYKDIAARRLLALNVGPRGQRLPDWQLDPLKRRLTQNVLEKTEGLDNWTIYRALSEPLEGLGGHSPVQTVTDDTIEAVTTAALNALGLIN